MAYVKTACRHVTLQPVIRFKKQRRYLSWMIIYGPIDYAGHRVLLKNSQNNEHKSGCLQSQLETTSMNSITVLLSFHSLAIEM